MAKYSYSYRVGLALKNYQNLTVVGNELVEGRCILLELIVIFNIEK